MNSSKKADAAKKSSIELLSTSSEVRQQALLAIAERLRNSRDPILEMNQKDIKYAVQNGLSAAIQDRLLLTEMRIENMAVAVEAIAHQPEVVFTTLEKKQRTDGLIIQKQSIPLGVIGIIFESRPNVVIDCAALCIKSANAVLLKGGKEAHYSNQILVEIVREAIRELLPIDSVQLLDSKEEAQELITMKGKVDVIIPRGSERLIQYVVENAKVPVIAHFQGLCHLYIDETANLEKAYRIAINSKCQRPGVCNAVESLILHQNVPKELLKRLHDGFVENGIEMRVSPSLQTAFPTAIPAVPEDWSTEYLDKIISILQVKDIEEAISHIQTFGSHHTEAICSENQSNIQLFLNSIDASCIMVNASTRFNDGGELGLGAEIGISTSKLHAYGPMGAKELTTSRFVVVGSGHVRK